MQDKDSNLPPIDEKIQLRSLGDGAMVMLDPRDGTTVLVDPRAEDNPVIGMPGKEAKS